MKEIIDIYLYRTDMDGIYDLEDSFFGRILKKDDKFEGIIREYDRELCYLVYGNIEGNSITFMKSSNGLIVDHRIVAKKENTGYYGIYSAAEGEIEIPITECKVSLLPAEQTREITTFEMKRLKQLIEEYQRTLPKDKKEAYVSWKNLQQQKQFIKK